MYTNITYDTVGANMKNIELPGDMTIFAKDFDCNAKLQENYRFVCTVKYVDGANIEVRTVCKDLHNKHHFVKLPGKVNFFSYHFHCGVELPIDYEFVFSMMYEVDGAENDANNVYIDGDKNYHFVKLPGQVKLFRYRFPCGVELPNDYKFDFSMKYQVDGADNDAFNVYIDNYGKQHFITLK